MHYHHDHSKNHFSDSSVNLSIAFFLNVGFSIIEIIGGLLTNSIAILSDAVHDLGDTVIIGFSWLMERYAQRKHTEDLTFGYKRFSLVGAILSSLVLLFGSVFILTRAVPRLLYPETVHPQGMLGLALLGIIINGFGVLKLRQGKKINERIIFLHLLEDVLGWMAILAVSIILMFYNIPVLDPLLSIAITIFIISKIVPNIKQTLKIFLQYSPDNIEIKQIKTLLEKIHYIDNVHDLHLWSLDGNYTVLSCHISINKNLTIIEMEKEKLKIKKMLYELGIAHVTIEFEPDSKICDECDL